MAINLTPHCSRPQRAATHGLLQLALLVLVAFTAAAQTVVRVDYAATGSGDGSSWTNAYTDLQAAINEAATHGTAALPAQIWIRFGTYYPTAGTDRSISFQLKNNIELYGGFLGNETTLEERDFRDYESILSGNIGNQSIALDNSLAIVKVADDITNSVLIDGVSFTAAYNTSDSSGGAIFFSSAANLLEIRNCKFYGNVANGGSGINAANRSLSTINVYSSVFYGNGWNGHASAIRVTGAAHIIGCLFYNNISLRGPVVYRDGASAFTMVNNTFYNNTFTQYGAVHIVDGVNALVANNISWGNTGPDEDIVWFNTDPTLVNNLIEGSVAGQGTIDLDPQFVDVSNGIFTLGSCSPAADKGDNAHVPASFLYDLDGKARIFNQTVDLGAYESENVSLFFSAVEIQNVSCKGGNDGQINVNGGGGSGGALTYSSDGEDYFSNPSFTGLEQGTYTIYLMEAGTGCIYQENFNVADPDDFAISNIEMIAAKCNGSADGEIHGTITGGSGPYRLSTDGGTTFATTQFAADFMVEGLEAGDIALTVVDANQCQFTFAPITVSEPEVITATVTTSELTCNTGQGIGFLTMANVSGGTWPYAYTIGNETAYLYSNISNTIALPVGDHVVVISDANGCTFEWEATVTELEPVGANIVVSDLSCPGASDGSVQLEGTGGTGPYEYSMDGSPYQSEALFEGLTSNNYSFRVRDSNGCEASLGSVYVDRPEYADVAWGGFGTTGCGAADGSIQLQRLTGGASPFTTSIDGVNYSSATIYESLVAGDYVAYVMDANGCIQTQQLTISDPPQATVSTAVTNVTCFGNNSGSVTISVADGVTPYQFSIDGGNTFHNNPIFSGLAAGSYAITVRQANGCSQDVDFEVSEPTQLQMSFAVIDALCVSEGNGSIEAAALGGTGSYSYSLNGGNSQASPVFSNLEAGEYTLRVVDENGCETEGIAEIEAPLAAASPFISNAITTYGTTASGIVISAGDAISTHFQVTGISGGDLYQADGVTAVAEGDFVNRQEGGAGLSLTPSAAGLASFYVQAATSDGSGCLGGEKLAVQIEVNKAPLLLVADNKARLYGTENPALTFTISGFVNGEDENAITQPLIATEATALSDAGAYPIIFSGGSAANYELSYQAGQLTVSKASQTIVFADLPDELETTDIITLEASASSALEVVFEVTGPATIDGNTLAFTGAGGVTVTALQAGNNNYEAAVQVSQNITAVAAIAAQDQEILFEVISDKTFGDGPFELVASATSGLTVHFEVIEGPIAVDGNTLTILGAGTAVIMASQEGNAFFTAAAPVSQSFVVDKLEAAITITGLEQEADGTPRPVTVTTLPEGLSYTVRYNDEPEVPVTEGTYAVMVTIEEANYHGIAEATFILTLSVETGLPDGMMPGIAKAYPNPSTGQIFISIEGDKNDQNKTIQLFDLQGRQYLTESFTGQQHSLNLQQLSPGIYLLSVHDRGGELLGNFRVKKE